MNEDKPSPNNVQPPSPAFTTGRDSLGKALGRNLSPARLRLLWQRGLSTLRQHGPQALWREFDFRLRLATHREVWRYRADIPLRRELKAQALTPPSPAPLISILVPLYNTPPRYLRQLLRSVLRQSYTNWQLVLADGSGGQAPLTEGIGQDFSQRDGRIVYAKLAGNGGISLNTNAAMALCQGDWVCLLDHDDVLQPNALFELAYCANQTGADLIYSDEIVLNETLRKLGEYHFKGDYGPHTLLGCNTITHLCAFTRALAQQATQGKTDINGNPVLLRPEYDGAQDYDLVLRLTQKAQCIRHIPKVLYFWRRHGGSTASGIQQKPKALIAGARALQDYFRRQNQPATVVPLQDHPGAYRCSFPLETPSAPNGADAAPLVSVLIPSSDHSEDLRRCLASLYTNAFYPAASGKAAPGFEVIVIDNNSSQPATEAFYQEALAKYPHLQVLRYTGAFNFSAINNFGARQARGQHLLLLNNDVEVLSSGFLQEMVMYSQQPNVGAVGAMLYYPDDTVQHAGLIIGIGGTAGVSHKGHQRGDGGDMYRLCTVQNVSAVTGAALMVKRALYQQQAGLDETRFGVAFNDVDFCLRLREQGLLNVFTPFAQGYHFESKSRGYDLEGQRKARFEKETAAFQQRWAGILAAGDPFYNPHFTLKFENFGYK